MVYTMNTNTWRCVPVPEITMGQKIKYLREQHNLTLEQVGDAVGVGKSTVRKWENGIIANMRRDKIAGLAKALHTTPAYLMGWEESPSADIPTPPPSLPLQRLTQAMDQLNDEGQTKLVDYADDLVSSGRYRPK